MFKQKLIMQLMKQIKIITKVYSTQKIYYLHRIPKTFIKILLFICSLAFLASCALNRVTKEQELKVVKSGKLIFKSNYFLEYDKSFKESLIYKDFYEAISAKLKDIGFIKVSNINQAMYIIRFSFNKIESRFLENNYISNNQYQLSSDILNKIYNENKKFILQAYVINKDKSYTKVLEGYTKEIVSKKDTLERQDLGALRFINCSIDSLFDNKLTNNESYKEYYYKCL